MADDINFVEYDIKAVEDELVESYEQTKRETLYPGDERRMLLLNLLPVIVGLKSSINDAGRQNLLRYARGKVLDAIGERTDTQRIPAQKAKTTLKFTLSSAQSSAILIPAGTRVSPDGKLYFATVQTLIIPAGQITGEVVAEAVEGGSEYNGFTAGQIKAIVDPVGFVSSVENIDTSSGGADIEPDDDGVNIWSGYRERIRQSVNKMSTAGAADGYIYWAKTADINIQDVSITSPTAGQVKITVLMQAGQIPDQQVLDNVLAACSDKKRRPLTDQVIVSAPGTVGYDIEFTYYISNENAADEANIRDRIEGAGGVVEQYSLWQRGKIGRTINPDYLKQQVLNAGAYRVDIVLPIYTEIAEDEVAVDSNVSVNYGGLL